MGKRTCRRPVLSRARCSCGGDAQRTGETGFGGTGAFPDTRPTLGAAVAARLGRHWPVGGCRRQEGAGRQLLRFANRSEVGLREAPAILRVLLWAAGATERPAQRSRAAARVSAEAAGRAHVIRGSSDTGRC